MMEYYKQMSSFTMMEYYKQMSSFTMTNDNLYVFTFMLSNITCLKLLKHGYSSWKFQTTFRKFYGRHTDLVHKFDTSVSHMLKGLLKGNVTGATCGAGNAHSFRNA